MNRREAIRQLFLDPQDHPISEAAHLLGWTNEELITELSSQFLTEPDEWLHRPVPASAIAILAFADSSYEAIERALGSEASLLPSLVRLKNLSIQLPAYQIAALESAARREQTTVNDLLARYLVDLICDEAPALEKTVEGFREAFHWPASIKKGIETRWMAAASAR